MSRKKACPCCYCGYVGGPHEMGCCVPETERLRDALFNIAHLSRVCTVDDAIAEARAALAPLPARKPKKPEPPAKYEPDPFVEGILARDVAPLPARGKRRKST